MPNTQTIADVRRELTALLNLYQGRLQGLRDIGMHADDHVFAYYTGFIDATERAILALS